MILQFNHEYSKLFGLQICHIDEWARVSMCVCIYLLAQKGQKCIVSLIMLVYRGISPCFMNPERLQVEAGNWWPWIGHNSNLS